MAAIATVKRILSVCDKYICRLREDQQGRLLGVEWEGGIYTSYCSGYPSSHHG